MSRIFKPPPGVQLVKPNPFVGKDVPDVKERLIKARDSGQPATVLIGAGCSMTGNILGAKDICKKIFDDYPKLYDWACLDAKGEGPTYNQCMHHLSSSEQRQLFSKLIESSHVNWGNFALACLMKEGYVGRVMTTNFDNLLVRACAMLDYYPGTYDMAVYRGDDGHESTNFQWSEVENDAIFYLHGQATGFRLLNDDESLLAHAKHIGDCFPFKNSNSPWLIVGYSGGTDPLFQEHISQPTTFPANLFWVSYLDNGVHPAVNDKLFSNNRGAYHVQGYDSDSFFVTLAQELGVLNQPLLQRPKEHLLEMLTALGPVPSRDGRGPVFEINSTLEQLRSPVARAPKTSKPKPTTQDLAMTFQGLLLDGKYDQVIKQFGALSPIEQEAHRDAAARAYYGLGNGIYWQIRKGPAKATAERWRECVSLYEKACLQNPRDAKLLRATCITLYELGRVVKPEAKVAIFRDAVQKAEQANALDQNDADILLSWTIALYQLGRAAEPKEKEAIFRDAVQKAEQANALDQDNQGILASWVIALYELGRVVEPSEKEAIFKAAVQKAEQSGALYKDDGNNQFGWSIALLELGRVVAPGEKEAIFRDAVQKAEQADALDQDDADILRNWAIALYELGRVVDPEEKEAIFRAAVEKAEQVNALDPDNGLNRQVWGISLYELGRVIEPAEKEETFRAAVQKMESALDINGKITYGWGWLRAALNELGSVQTGEAQAETYRQAAEAQKRQDEIDKGR